jgi:all-trans-retinol 13,14-reductase
MKYKFPNIEEQIDSYFSATPLTIKDYTGSKEGSLYGYVKDYNHLECSHLSPFTKINNLFLAGQNINLHGILGVPLNSIMTVGAVMGDINSIIEKISLC